MKAGRGWLAWAALAYAAIIAAVTFGLTTLYEDSRARLDEAMGDRLLAAARSLAAMTDGGLVALASVGDSTGAAYLESLAEDFEVVRQETGLSEITLTDVIDDRVVFSTSEGLVPDEANPYWSLDPGAAEAAKAGDAAATALYDLAGLYQKSAHAPVFDYDVEGRYPVAVITVSGAPDFFSALDRLRNAALVTGGAVLAVLVAMGIFIWRIHLALARSRLAVLRQENLAAMGRMTAGIAHEIRNPLGIIKGAGQHLQVVLAGAGLDDEIARFIPDEVDRLDQILTGYLAFGRGAESEPEVFDLGDAVQRAVGLVAEELREVGVKCEVAVPDSETPVRGDPRRFRQVMLNLLLNARDAMPDGGTVEVALERKDSRARLTVRDGGAGIDPDAAAHLFEPFWTSKEKGGGLGLALSRGIVEDMGGSLDLRGHPGGPGAVATVDLPLAAR